MSFSRRLLIRLAWQENPGLPFGTAITAKYFGVGSPEALKFVEWFKQLFS